MSSETSATYSTNNTPRLKRAESTGINIGRNFQILKRGTRPTALLRRTSSFGGGPIVQHNVAIGSLGDRSVRWTVLLLACLLLFGNYYAYDNPASLNVPLQEYLGHTYDDWQYELNLLYSVYSFPNMFLPFLGGRLIDRYDIKKVLFAVSLLVCTGQTIFSIGVSLKSFPLMIIGRILFGIGGETVSVTQSSITTIFFKGKELAFALGMNLCIARLGSVMNSILSPKLAKQFSVPIAVWCGTITCFVSFIAVLILIGILASNSSLIDRSEDANNANTSTVADIANESTSLLNHPKPASLFQDISRLPKTFWILCTICILLYGTVVPFNTIASDFLMSKWYPGDTQMAGFVMR